MKPSMKLQHREQSSSTARSRHADTAGADGAPWHWGLLFSHLSATWRQYWPYFDSEDVHIVFRVSQERTVTLKGGWMMITLVKWSDKNPYPNLSSSMAGGKETRELLPLALVHTQVSRDVPSNVVKTGLNGKYENMNHHVNQISHTIAFRYNS